MFTRTYRVTTNDGTFDVETTFDAWCSWEEKFNRSRVDPNYTLKLRDHCYVIWKSCMTRDIVVPLNFEDFIKKVQTFELVEDKRVRPTKAAPTAAD